MTPTFLSIQGSYQHIEVALYKGAVCLELRKDESMRGSSQLIPIIDSLLKSHNVSIKDLSFIAVDQGPGAFTSLRVALTTVNGIAYAAKIPLIGINGLESLARQSWQSLNNDFRWPHIQWIVPLLNAYNNDVYVAVYEAESFVSFDVAQDERHFSLHTPQVSKNIELVLNGVKALAPQDMILFTGNGATMHQELIKKTFNDQALLAPEMTSSAEQIAQMALQEWHKGKSDCFKLLPVYLKTQNFAIRKAS